MTEQSGSNIDTTWPITRVTSVDELRDVIDEVKRDVRSTGSEAIAWRGNASMGWFLESTLDRKLRERVPDESYEQWVSREKAVLARFRQEAQTYATDEEKRLLMDDWSAMALGRHSGLPTRILDWTRSPWVAAWFACHEQGDDDGLIWWFSQRQLEVVVGAEWNNFHVPTRRDVWRLHDRPDLTDALGLDERVLEATAFDTNGPAWITKVHYSLCCSRMNAQQGFMTACGRLRKTHSDAIDELPGGDSIGRGRIRIPGHIKGGVLNYLREMNIHARSLEYPGLDIVAARISV